MRTLTEILKEKSNGQEELNKFILGDDGKVKANWERIRRHITENAHNEPLKVIDETYEILMKLGILSSKVEENYLLTDGDFVLNPTWNFESLYFTRLEDVKEYKEVEYGNRQISTFIFKGI